MFEHDEEKGLDDTTKQKKRKPRANIRVCKIVMTQLFICFVLNKFISMVIQIFIEGNFKIIGLIYIRQDMFLTMAGSIGQIGGIFARFGCPALMDYFSFKSISLVINISMFFFYATMPFILTFPWPYLI